MTLKRTLQALAVASTVVVAVSAVLLFRARTARAHCDSVDGPVVTAARRALETNNVNVVLGWVRDRDETAIRTAFERAMRVRRLNPEARSLADTYFYETLVRVHREGEGAPYTGLKPALGNQGPFAAADRAIAEGSVDALAERMADEVRSAVTERFQRVMATRNYNATDLRAARQHVAAYVDYVHFVEGVHTLLHRGAEAAEPGSRPASGHAH